MKIRFYNCRILTLKDNYDLNDSELWVDRNKIVYIGPYKENNIAWDREIDVNNNLLMPGFKNAHTHSAMTFLRSYADDLPLQDWLFNKVFPLEEKLNEEDIYTLSILAILEYITSGITANFDMYYMPYSIAKASVDCGFRTVLVGAVSNYKQSLDQIEECYYMLNNYHELISFCIGFHAEYTASKELLQGIAKLAEKLKAPVFSHNSETNSEVLQCIKRYNMTPTMLFDSLGLYNYGGGGYHCVCMNENDLNIYKNKNLSIITNPGSNIKLASGIMDLKKALDLGINIGIGTDGPASNNSLDMFREMYLASCLTKIRNMDAVGIMAAKVLSMSTVGGARAMGLNNCDVLDVGKAADVIMIDLHQPNMQPENNIINNIVYSGSKINIKMTMINGKILYEDYQFKIGIDTEKIYKEANKIINRVSR